MDGIGVEGLSGRLPMTLAEASLPPEPECELEYESALRASDRPRRGSSSSSLRLACKGACRLSGTLSGIAMADGESDAVYEAGGVGM